MSLTPSLTLISRSALVLIAALAAAPAGAQSREGGSSELVVAPCQPGNITCYARRDADCRSVGGFIRLAMTSASAVTLVCSSDRNDLDRVFREEQAQTTTCTAGHLCIRQGTRTGEESNIYRQMVGMMNSCLASNGLLEVHGILPDGPNSSTLYAGCLRRA